MTRPSDTDAKWRMRALRARSGGATIFDRARNHATRSLIERHRAEFDQLRTDYVRVAIMEETEK